MSFPWIIWCRQRTGSTSLFHSLCSASENPPAEIECFDFGNVSDREFTHVGKRMPPGERDKALRLICDRRLLIKHCYENLSEDFNHALAEISTRAGYRHIHLFRRDEIARLISKGLAEQHGTWGASEFTRARHAAWLATGEKLPPLDVAALKQYHDLCESRWMAVSGLLRAHDVEFEQLTREPGRVLDRLAVYLRLPSAFVPGMCRKLGRGQDSRDVWRLIPNTNKLQAAIYPGEPVRRSAAFYWSVK